MPGSRGQTGDWCNNMSEIYKWKKFGNNIKNKRTDATGKQNKGAKSSKNARSCSSIEENKEIILQPLASEATGKPKKYKRTGPQEFVPFYYK